MKPLLGVLAFVGIAVGGWLVLNASSGGEAEDSSRDIPQNQQEADDSGAKVDPAKPPGQTAAAQDADQRELWRKLRPAVERLVPDPDKVGPCPPISIGGLAEPVVRRFIDRDTGCPTWIHDDGNRTVYHPRVEGRDPDGRLRYGVGSVSTFVRTTPKPIAPEELLHSGQDPRKDKSGAKGPAKAPPKKQ